MTTVWKVHPVFTDYEVSDAGSVRRATRKTGTRVGRVKKQTLATTGYNVVMIGTKPKKVHVLVLETFVGPRPEGCDGCHVNGMRTDNALANLKWATRTENMRDARVHGTDSRCDRHGCAKLTFDQVREIRARVAAGELQKHLAPVFGISSGHVSYIVNKGWKL